MEWNLPFARWFVEGKLNASFNALDVHQKNKAKKPAILWEGENGDSRILTYEDLWIQVKKFSNALKTLGVKKLLRIFRDDSELAQWYLLFFNDVKAFYKEGLQILNLTTIFPKSLKGWSKHSL